MNDQTTDRRSNLPSLHESIDKAFNAIRSKQKQLNRIQDNGYNAQTIQQQLVTLTELQTQIQGLTEQSTQLTPEALADFRAKSEPVKMRLSQVGKALSTDRISVDRATIRKHIYEVVSQLDVILDELTIDISNTTPDAETVATTGLSSDRFKATLDELRSAIANEKRVILIGDLGQSSRSAILKELDQLSCLLYRMRQLADEPRLANRKSQLTLIAKQIEDTVNHLDAIDRPAAKLLETTAQTIERQLYRYEYNRLWFLPFGWVINRYNDINRLKSVQARVLAGLATSLTISGSIFITFTIVLTAISAYESIPERIASIEINIQREELFKAVEKFLQYETEVEVKQAQINSLTDQISSLDAQILNLENKNQAQASLAEAENLNLAASPLPTPASSAGQDPPQSSDELDSEDGELETLSNQRKRLIQQQDILIQQKAELEVKRQTGKNAISQILISNNVLQINCILITSSIPVID